jgi:hypothetical protein
MHTWRHLKPYDVRWHHPYYISYMSGPGLCFMSGKALRRGPYAMDLGLRLAFTWLEAFSYTLASQQTFFTLAFLNNVQVLVQINSISESVVFFYGRKLVKLLQKAKDLLKNEGFKYNKLV